MLLDKNYYRFPKSSFLPVLLAIFGFVDIVLFLINNPFFQSPN